MKGYPVGETTTQRTRPGKYLTLLFAVESGHAVTVSPTIREETGTESESKCGLRMIW